MFQSRYTKKLSVLLAVLTGAAAVIILVMSVLPPFFLSSGTPANSGIILYRIAYGILFFLICMWLLFAGNRPALERLRQMRMPGYWKKISVLHAVLTVTAALIILVLSVMPPLSLSSGIPANSGIVLHMIAYGVLCFLTCMCLRVMGNTQSPMLRAFFFSSMYGLLIECIQLGVPYRSFEMSDILINCLAAAVAIIPCSVMIRYVPLYKNQPNPKALLLDR